jgi:AbrB family looped-hinge helix DNA binding protein
MPAGKLLVISSKQQLTIKLANGNSSAMHITLDRMSRIVVPKAIRDRFAMKPGDDLEITIEADGIRLRPTAPASPLADEDGLLVCSSEVPSSTWDLGAFIDEQRTQRSTEIGGL